MKIAIDINELTLKNNTGVKVYTREILNALGRIDKENKYFLYANCKHESMSRFYWINYKNFKFKTIESSFPFWTYTKFSKEIKKDKPDILFMPIQAVPFFKKPKNIKIVVTVHDLAFLLFPNQFTEKDKLLLTFHTKRAINMADSIIVPSEATKKDIIKFYGTDDKKNVMARLLSNKIKVIYHGVKVQNCSSSVIARRLSEQSERKADAAIPRLSTQNYNIKSYDANNGIATVVPLPRNDNPYIFFVGQIQPRKNLIRLIEAFEIIKEKNRKYPNLKLIIAGGKGWMAEKTYQKAKKSEFSKDIVFKGKVSDEDLVKLYQNSMMFVLPSLYEGFGLPVLEAMSYGAPCIVSDNSSLSEIVDDHAMLINANSSDDIAEKISMFLLHDSLRDDYSKRSLENVKKFNWEESAKMTLKVFEEVFSM